MKTESILTWTVLTACCLAATPRPGFGAPQADLVGRVHLVWDAEQTPDNVDGVLVYVVDDEGLATRLQMDGGSQLQAFQGVDRRRVQVRAGAILPGPFQAPVLRPLSVRPVGAPLSLAGKAGANGLDFMTVLCRFTDDPREPLAPTRLERVVGPDYPGMQQYYAELSWTPGTMAGNRVTPVWYDLPGPRSHYLQGNQVALDLLARDCTTAAAVDVDFSAYYGINLQFGGALNSRATAPYDVLSFGGSWTLTLNGQTRVWGMTWMSIDHAENHVVYAHEMGHALGWPHSSGRQGGDYGSNWDVMSRGYLRHELPWGWLTVHTIGAHKDALGWIPATRRWAPTLGVAESGGLARTSLPSAQGYLLAVIGQDPDRFYTAEVRQPAGHDIGIPGKAVVIHEVVLGRAYVVDGDLNGDPNDQGAMWTSGETFTDSLTGLTLRVDSETPQGFDVTITRGWRLDVAATGGGEVGIHTAAVADSPCLSAACSRLYPIRGTTVRITAKPLEGWVLRGWSGACTGDTSCTVTMGSHRTVGAVFGRELAESSMLALLFDRAHPVAIDDLQYLDGLGNGNGRFDLGDMRAWLAHTGVLGTSGPTPWPSAARDTEGTP